MGNTSFLFAPCSQIYGAERLVSGESALARILASERFKHSAYCKYYGQATKSMRVDALAQVGDEGRGQLR